VAAGVVVATIAGAWLVAPVESRSFWRHLGPDVTTVGPVTAVDHWSINGAVWRVAGEGGNQVAWLLLAVPTLAVTLVLARMWWRAGSPIGAMGLVALGGVLASPFSWSHHWVAVAPLFVALLAEAGRARRPRLIRTVIAASYALVLTTAWYHGPRKALAPLLGGDHTEALAANSYLLVAAALLALAWALRPSPRAVSFDSTTVSRVRDHAGSGRVPVDIA
jgi:alpha-1,2-mannosyltransferase